MITGKLLQMSYNKFVKAPIINKLYKYRTDSNSL